MTSSARQFGFACLLCGHAALTFFLSYHRSPFAVGVVIGQVAVLSIWAALGPGRLTDRLPRTAFLLVMLWYTVLWAYRAGVWAMSLDESLRYLIGMIAEFLVLLIAFWLTRQFLGWRIERQDVAEEAESLRETQFRMGRLLAWIGGIAVLLAMGRYLLPRIRLVRLELSWEVLLLCSVLSLSTAVIAVPVVCVVPRATRRWFAWSFIMAAYVMIVSMIELSIVLTFLPIDHQEAFFLPNVTLPMVLAVTLIVLHWLGFTMSPRAWPHPDELPGGSPGTTVENSNR